METLFRKQFWVVNLLMLAANAFLLARGSNQLVAWALLQDLGTPAARAATLPRGHARDQRPRVSQVNEEENIFGARVESPLELAAALAPPVEPAEKTISDAEPVPTALRLKLTGVTWFEERTFSLASIEEQSSHDTNLYSVNACPPEPEVDPDQDEETSPHTPPCNLLMEEHTILEIERDRVVFLNATASRREYLSLYEEPATGGMAAAPPVRPVQVASQDTKMDLGKGVQKLSDTQYRIPQDDLDEVMGNMNSVATQARIVPSFENGRANGFKLFSIRPGSIFSKIGIQNGDVISKINGYDINSPDKALEVYAKLKDSKEITVELKRRGNPQTMNYSIQ